MSTSRASKIIRENKQEILERWIEKVNEEIPDAKERDNPIIRNSVPDLLDALAEALACDDARKVIHESGKHGRERANYTQFSVDQIVREYRLLRETIFTVTDEHGDDLKGRERDGIMYAIDQALEQSTAVFDRIHTEKTQLVIEKAEELISELEARDGLRDQFIASLSHDIRTPLGNTQQLVELLQDRLASAEDTFIGKALRGIKISAEQGNALINTLMDVNLIQSGNPIPLQKSNSDLLAELSKSLDSLKPDLRERITLDSPYERIMGYWDARALIRAINNLISNANKYGARDEKITISLQQDEQTTTVSVHNTGNPIPPDKLDKLFDIYYRAPDLKAQGWGLGLTLVKGIVEMHGGSIAVSSDAENGTSFTLYLPTAT